MTLARPVLAPLPPRGRRWGLLLGVAVVVAVIAYVAFSSVGNALVYYLTPTELEARLARGDTVIGETVRLGGLVKPGSVHGEAPALIFVLTDGTTDITVRASTAPTRSFREGVGAVVEGQVTIEGGFEANEVIVKHDENYVAPSEGALPTQGFVPGT